jgi:N-methylhydantoinase B/oxoprolinase/acetone carboxylase alpha subunit
VTDLNVASLDSPAVIEAWQCIGCGRVEAPQPCIGVCQDRKVRFVYAADHEAALAHLVDTEARLAALESLARRLAQTTPRDGAWEQSFRALQNEARRALTAASAKRSDRETAASEDDQPEP